MVGNTFNQLKERIFRRNDISQKVKLRILMPASSQSLQKDLRKTHHGKRLDACMHDVHIITLLQTAHSTKPAHIPIELTDSQVAGTANAQAVRLPYQRLCKDPSISEVDSESQEQTFLD